MRRNGAVPRPKPFEFPMFLQGPCPIPGSEKLQKTHMFHAFSVIWLGNLVPFRHCNTLYYWPNIAGGSRRAEISA